MKTPRVVPILVIEEEGKRPSFYFQSELARISLAIEKEYAQGENNSAKVAELAEAEEAVRTLEKNLLPPEEVRSLQGALLQIESLAEGLILTEQSLQKMKVPNWELSTHHALCAVTTGSLGTAGMQVCIAFSKEAMRNHLAMFEGDPRQEGVLQLAESVRLPMPEKRIALDEALDSYLARLSRPGRR